MVSRRLDGDCAVSTAIAAARWPRTATQPQAGGFSPRHRSEKRPAAFHVEEATIADIQHAITTKQITTVKLVNLYLARIKAYNGTCVSQPKGILGPVSTIPHAGQLNALITLNLRPAARKAWAFDDRKARSMTDTVDADPKMPDALEVAAAQDRQFAQTGRLVGPLQGVVMAPSRISTTRSTCARPLARSRSTPTIGRRTTPPWRSDSERRARSPLGANRGSYQGRSPFGGTVCNPYDTERTTRGSSSGSAAGVAANLVTCAIGEETACPSVEASSSDNVVGLSPTQELISRNGMNGPGVNVRMGPICRTVEDDARVLGAVVGYDPRDTFTAFSVGRIPTEPYQSFVQGNRLEGVRIGVVREYMDLRPSPSATRR